MDVMAFNNKGTTFNEMQLYEKAIECFNKAIMVNHESDIAWLKKGNSLFNLGRFKDSIKCYDRAFALNAKNAEAIKNKRFAMEKLNMI
jgi:tetratricopeptide (TPR) repeat protein